MGTKDKSAESVYRVTEVIGTSSQSWEDAAKTAVQKVIEFRTRLQLSFKYES
jgi:flavin-binding protein dodecin